MYMYFLDASVMIRSSRRLVLFETGTLLQSRRKGNPLSIDLKIHNVLRRS